MILNIKYLIGVNMKKIITITPFATLKSKKEALAKAGVGSLLAVGADSKTVKGQKKGYNTAVLYMLPNLQLCPYSRKAGCYEGCLVSAGKGRFDSVKSARKRKTDLFSSNPKLFFSAMFDELERLHKKHKQTLVVRLNGTSDIDYMNIKLKYNGVVGNVFEHFPMIQFYDYTKVYSRIKRARPSNYDLTLSYSGSSEDYVQKVNYYHKQHGARIAVVFDKIPTQWNGYKVINGDETDLRFLDDAGTVIGLKAKGQAKKDQSGFVVKTI